MSEKTPDQIVSEYWGHFHGGTMSFETVVKEIVRAEREASERKVKMLKEALEPFAKASETLFDITPDEQQMVKYVKAGHLRLAASTLEEVTK